ncbi:MAG: DUF192 domain-containing protein [Deltaproteobacteria bacterium]|jgi:uncharacterized membrane protein (UPF0127 family)|nr:DUF192 domain-containing protein [Deltaproteobacteria bacterium]MBW2498205.1 DUF192 domain-containing protein [Deltaproteobacteria bacterium]
MKRSRPTPPSSRRAASSVAPRLALLLFALVGFACAQSDTESPATEGWVEIRGHRVSVEIADSPDEQSLGLGERDSLAWDHGMLFVYDRPAFYAFWMKGMRFSIDILWMREGRIVEIAPSVPFEPGGNGPTLRPRTLADSVLEVPAGYAAARGWRVGDRVRFERTPRG